MKRLSTDSLSREGSSEMHREWLEDHASFGLSSGAQQHLQLAVVEPFVDGQRKARLTSAK